VGQALAARLGWGFQDFDQTVEISSGLPIREIFRQHGEGSFREMEGEVGRELLLKDAVVLASGGGWPTVEGRMERLPAGTFTVWLKVTPEEAVRRAMRQGSERPLLAVPDPLGRARALLAQREVHYQKADLAMDSQRGDPEDLASLIEKRMNESGRERLPSTSA
jgi:shikimate kinase